MTDDVKGGPLPGVMSGPNEPTGVPANGDQITGAGKGLDTGKPGTGSGGVQPVPNPSGIPGKSHAGEGEDKGDLAPSPDQALNDIKKGSR
jgi:hypothetical protein